MDRISYVFNVPYRDELKDYSWIGDYERGLALQALIRDYNAERKRLRDLPKDQADFKKVALASYRLHRERLVRLVANFLRPQVNSKDPFSRFEHLAENTAVARMIFTIPPDILSDAIDSLADSNAISDKDRAKALAAVDRKIEKAEQQLAEVSPERYFAFQNGVVLEDKRVAFVTKWRNVQAMVREPVGPHGLALKHSPPAEQKAHRRLEIHKAISPKTGRLPADARQFVTEKPSDGNRSRYPMHFG
jgi:hypothetical protein